MTGILGQIKRESLLIRKGEMLLYKGLEGKFRIHTMTLSPRIGAVEIHTHWHCRYLQLAKKLTNAVSFHRLSVTGMTFQILSAEMSDDCESKFASIMRARD